MKYLHESDFVTYPVLHTEYEALWGGLPSYAVLSAGVLGQYCIST